MNKVTASYGIILFSIVNHTPRFLIYERRDSYGYMDFLRGKWTQENILMLFSLMTEDERHRLLSFTFDELWYDMWFGCVSKIPAVHYENAKRKFQSIEDKIPLYIQLTTPTKEKTMWCFPKGKKSSSRESDMECALREFTEETKIDSSKIRILPMHPHREVYKGNNGRTYSTTYFVAHIDTPIDPKKIDTPECIRKTAISEEANNILWVSCADARLKISPPRQAILKKITLLLDERKDILVKDRPLSEDSPPEKLNKLSLSGNKFCK
jgi:8-oxo-dGTP pyrophosphatase MutT (NUDIX family)